jgi:hypothetical protein
VAELADAQDLGSCGRKAVQVQLLSPAPNSKKKRGHDRKEPNPSAAFVAELWDRHNVLFCPEAFPDVAAVRSKLAEIEKEQAEFVNGVTNESLQRMLPLRNTQLSLGHLMQHIANHSTYHRGQVGINALAQCGGE